MERQIGRKIKELKIGNVGKDMNQFLRFGQNTGIATLDLVLRNTPSSPTKT